jgi:hypothetical protein
MRVKALALIELELVGISTSGSPARLALPHLSGAAVFLHFAQPSQQVVYVPDIRYQTDRE